MELRHLRYFLAVADEGSISEAARTRLNTAQPSLSRQIRDLEEKLGVALFERRVRGMALTPIGKLFLGHVRKILKQVDDAVAEVQGSPLVVRTGIIPGLETSILPELARLARRHVGEVDIQVTSSPSASLIQDLKDGTLDVAFARPAELEVDLHFEPICGHRIAAFVRDDSALAERPALRFDDLRDHTYVSVNRRVAPFLRGALDSWGQQRALAMPSTHVAADIASAFSLVLATGGFALMPDYAEQLMPSRVVMRPLADGPPPLMLAIAYRPLVPSPAQSLIKAIAEDWPRAAA
ncbi:LysR family transcriptional regulator [Rhodoplanes roseus]|uniref:HTH lysR-type domain-containing protein n=1 Tax=Rhodoplanes roseus TaxID=29409 RepID=A0A327KST1_9BRAD|nr:LysR substrate-binding domain-containing protein [Rhodoplanes roseus]RAI40703.1 hypothetical protein CH341_23215 [Rhodoplanes roseus]